MLANVLTRQQESPLHDTQVAVEDAVGFPTRVSNANATQLEKSNVPTCVQRAHHWSPLKKETEMLETARDAQNGIFDAPKDRHVFPFVECLARFGVIQ